MATASPARCTTGRSRCATGQALGDDDGCVPTIPVRVDARARADLLREASCVDQPAALTLTRDPHHLRLLRRRLRHRRHASPASARSRSRAIPTHPANRGKLCSKGTHLGETVGLEGGCSIPMIGKAAGELGQGARPRRPALRRDDRPARPRQRRLLRLRPAADRGLLRRQQADEGLHRLGQHRHQLAAVHVERGRRPYPRVRRGRRARQLRRSRRRPT